MENQNKTNLLRKSSHARKNSRPTSEKQPTWINRVNKKNQLRPTWLNPGISVNYINVGDGWTDGEGPHVGLTFLRREFGAVQRRRRT
jgi:hypothetical protein